MEKLVKAWKAGDEKTIETLMLQDAKDADEAKINALMLDNRNVDMVKKIEELLKGKEKGFVVVGAAHLIGEKGILKALEKDKYTVERPELTVPARPAATAPAELK